ncbi:MAG: hypothetical protein KGL39_60425, partial [Patescibacteria group bacterium]|nr:hypothetical protein [Patescibacteria group bacterium]
KSDKAETKTTTITTATPPEPQTTRLDELNKLCAEDGIYEAVLVQHMRNLGMVDETLSSLKEIFEMAPAAIDKVVSSWKKAILPKLPKIETK